MRVKIFKTQQLSRAPQEKLGREAGGGAGEGGC